MNRQNSRNHRMGCFKYENDHRNFESHYFTLIIFLMFLSVGCSEDKAPQPVIDTWMVTTIAGNEQGFEDGDVTSAKFNTPMGLALSSDGLLYVADFYNKRIRIVSPDGFVSTLGGGLDGYLDGPIDVARFDGPYGMVITGDGTIYFTDYSNSKIRKISNGIVTTLAGGIGGNADGIGMEAGFDHPRGITMGIDSCLYVTDYTNNSIRRITLDGEVTTYAGSRETLSGYKDGHKAIALFWHPTDICSGPDGTLYIVEEENRRVRKISPNGLVSTIAGNGNIGYGTGKGINASFFSPQGIVYMPDGSLLVADNDRIRKILSTGEVQNIFALEKKSTQNGETTYAQFFSLNDIILAADGSLRISDCNHYRICKLELQK